MSNPLLRHLISVYGTQQEAAKRLEVTTGSVQHWIYKCPSCFLKYLPRHLMWMRVLDLLDEADDKQNCYDVVQIVMRTRTLLTGEKVQENSLQGHLD